LTSSPCRPETGTPDGLNDSSGKPIVIRRKHLQRVRVDPSILPNDILDLHRPTDTRTSQDIRVLRTEIGQELREIVHLG
jgi:hypothetical protein